ncbi:MAG: hypothetical protein AAFU41_04180 [Pseudomonadota bacterium]
MTPRKSLLLILAFVALTLGSFIWYIATWDDRKGGGQPSHVTLPELSLPEAPAYQQGATV